MSSLRTRCIGTCRSNQTKCATCSSAVSPGLCWPESPVLIHRKPNMLQLPGESAEKVQEDGLTLSRRASSSSVSVFSGRPSFLASAGFEMSAGTDTALSVVGVGERYSGASRCVAVVVPHWVEAECLTVFQLRFALV